jgi:glycine cleavage system H protein
VEIPAQLRYSPDHEWIRMDGETGTIGITAFAAHELSDIVYVELPAVGRQLQAGTTFGAIESVKTVSDLLAPVSGIVTAVNTALADRPDLVTADPYAEGWIIQLRVSDPAELGALLDADAYRIQAGG